MKLNDVYKYIHVYTEYVYKCRLLVIITIINTGNKNIKSKMFSHLHIKLNVDFFDKYTQMFGINIRNHWKLKLV